MSNEGKEAQLEDFVEDMLLRIEHDTIHNYPGTFRTAMDTETGQSLNTVYAEKRGAFKELLKAHIRWALWMHDE